MQFTLFNIFPKRVQCLYLLITLNTSKSTFANQFPWTKSSSLFPLEQTFVRRLSLFYCVWYGTNFMLWNFRSDILGHPPSNLLKSIANMYFSDTLLFQEQKCEATRLVWRFSAKVMMTEYLKRNCLLHSQRKYPIDISFTLQYRIFKSKVGTDTYIPLGPFI